ncbi:ABC transporter permease [Microbacterium sp. ZW T5_56]|uniref:ABC transporter permease n=1 Tax=Microbacterium sp. ZW T5_56 TaxID=3378081 RepID=UPI003852B20C
MTWVIDNLGLIWSLTLEHVAQCAVPILLGFLLALPVGWVAHRYTRVRGVVLSLVGVLYAIPSFGLFAVLSSLFGIEYLSPTNLVVALTIYAVALMTRSVADAFDSVDDDARQAATAIGYSRVRRFFTVELPLAGPVLLAGLRVATVSTVALATVGILIGVENLGYLFTNGSQRRIVAEVLAGVVAVGLMAWVFDLILVGLGRLLLPWNRSAPRVARTRRVVATA